MNPARVQSVDALRDVKAALIQFSEAVKTSFVSVDADIQRVSDWLIRERPAHWKHEVRRRSDEVAQAKAAVQRKGIISAPEPASVIEERKAVQRAERRLGVARGKLDAVKRWGPAWEREALLYKTACRGMSDAVSRDIPAAIDRLDRMIASLEAYLKLQAPTVDEPPPVGITADESASPAQPAPPPAPGAAPLPGDPA